jgi:hypothetical protein
MDDYTASLLYDRFPEYERDDLDKVLLRCLKGNKKVTYNILEEGYKVNKVKEKKEEEELIEVVYECKEDCKVCLRHVACLPMYKVIYPYLAKIMQGDIRYEKVMEELHELYPFVGFNKKIGDATGVTRDENGEYITVYKYS